MRIAFRNDTGHPATGSLPARFLFCAVLAAPLCAGAVASSVGSDTPTSVHLGAGAIQTLTPLAPMPNGVNGITDPVIYDSFTGATLTSTGSTPRTFMGGAGTFQAV